MNKDKVKEYKTGICSKCQKVKELVKGKRCRDCKNSAEQKRRTNQSDEKKEEFRLKERQRYATKKANIVDVVVDESETKVCTVCNQEKSLSEFYVAKCKGKIRAECKECASKWRKDNYQKNREKVIKQTYAYMKKKLETDPNFSIERKTRRQIFNDMSSKKYKDKTIKNLGCSKSFFDEWIEFQFTNGMTRENYGDYWHIDHVKPCSSFDFSKEEEIAECFNWKNTQPLIGEENLSKSNKINEKMIKEHHEKVKQFLAERS